ncbi:hypothetical protein [Micromonospora sp. L32]|uniref:hypothetical protein n=1 Tax=Micromonospora sp. L32 TaxID=3452214 RepID=UPI003F8A088B
MNGTANTTSDRHLLAEVSRWRKANGWTLSGQRGWVNARCSADATVAVDYHPYRDGFTVACKDDRTGTWPLYPDFRAADSVRQAVDMLVALDILPARLSSLADTMLRLADELESEGSTDQLDSAYRIRLVLDGEYEPTGDPR